MGRPLGSKNKSTVLMSKTLLPPVKADSRSDDEIISEIVSRFNIYYNMILGAQENAITALIVSGSAGVGKSYTAEWSLEQLHQSNGARYQIVRGMISAIDLYELAYTYRNAGDVIVLDDADQIFDDEIGLNLLKCLLDTSLERKVNWMTDHPRFKGENALPKEFTYGGSIVFLTNKNFQEYVDLGTGKYVEHMLALLSRSIYLDLKMHTRREVCLWTKHLVIKNKILQKLGVSAEVETMLIEWLVKNVNELRELSLRTALKVGKIYMMNPNEWERVASILLLRDTAKVPAV